MEPLRIHLFGGFLLQRGDSTLPPIASRAGRSLFAYLAMNRDRPHQRDHLAGTFWADHPEGRARRRLSQTLWLIQDVVNADSVSYLEVSSDTLAFNTSSPYWLDVEEFERQVADAGADSGQHPGDVDRLRAAVELYRGDFLAGYFDDWAILEQEHYRQNYLKALRRLVDVVKGEGAYDEALAFARRLTHHDPLSEEAHREVMRLSYLLGRVNEAIEQFERCRSVLEEELGTEPSPPTVEIYEKIVRQRRAGISPTVDKQTTLLERRLESPFVGREAERRLLVDALERVLNGTGGVVMVEGEPGVGKTRLTMEAAEDARWRGFDVSRGSCSPGAVRPFAPLIEVIESLSPLRVEQLTEQVAPVWLDEAMRLATTGDAKDAVDTPATLRPGEASTRMREALLNTLSALGKIAPHVIVIDDVQWADRDTLSVLSQLGARLGGSRVLVMAVYRSEETRGDADVWDVLRELDRIMGMGRVVLSPLSVFELDEMVRKILGVSRLDPVVAAQLHRHTGGNALFTLETIMAMRDRGLFNARTDPVRVLGDELDSSGVPLAPRVRSVLESRMSLLRDDVAEIYRIAAVCGTGTDLTLLESVADLPRTTVLRAVDELLYRGLIDEEDTGRYRIAHDQARQVVYESVDPERRAHLHGVIAEMIAAREPDNVEAIGYHFQQSGDAERATSFLERAGRRAIALNAYATARQHLQAARRTSLQAAWSDEARYHLLGRLEEVLSVLGSRADQHHVLAEMSALVESLPSLRGDLERRRAWLLALTEDLKGAEESARVSVELEQAVSAGAVSTSLVALGTIQRWSGRALEAVPSLEEAVRRATDDRQRGDALTELASTLVEVQRAEEALPHLNEADTIYERLDSLRGRAEVAGIEARALRIRGDRDGAMGRYQSAIELCSRIGYRHGEGLNLTNLANLTQLLGGVAKALDGYDRAARIFDDLGNRRGEAMVLANSASARHNLLGEDARARLDAVKAMNHFAETGDRAREAQCLEILAGITAREGDRAGASQLLEESLDTLAGTGNVSLEGQHLRSLALLQLGDHDTAAAHATLDRGDELCAEAGLDDLAVELDSIRGLVHLAEGRATEALDVVRSAVDGLSPGVERAYLVHHRHALVAEAAQEAEEARAASLRADALLRDALTGLAAGPLQRAIEHVPEHREITTAASRFAPHVIETRLPAADAPMTRRPSSDELQVVRWTVDHPDDELIPSPIERRRRRLLRLLEEAHAAGGLPSISDLAKALAVGVTTVRRDLRALRDEGHEVATRGQRRVS